jgi:Tn3 transposase DDE domain
MPRREILSPVQRQALLEIPVESGRLDRAVYARMDARIRTPKARPGGLNKGEARNALARAVFFNRQGELRDRTFENQRYRANGLNLVVLAIILWNTIYLGRAIDALRQHGIGFPDALLAHVSAIGWEHINLTGDYTWHPNRRVSQGRFRPLRPVGMPITVGGASFVRLSVQGCRYHWPLCLS